MDHLPTVATEGSSEILEAPSVLADPAVAASPSPPEPTQPDGAAPPQPRQIRRRRTASLLPPLPRPIDIPEDASGRVDFISAGPAWTVARALPAPAGDPVPPSTAVDPAPAGLPSWQAVVIVGAVLVLLFIVGMLATR